MAEQDTSEHLLTQILIAQQRTSERVEAVGMLVLSMVLVMAGSAVLIAGDVSRQLGEEVPGIFVGTAIVLGCLSLGAAYQGMRGLVGER